MASYIPVPRDLGRVKSKILFGLTRRQLICFGAAALIGVPSYFFFRRIGGVSLATLCMILIMLPLFLLAMYERDGQPLEVIARHFIESKFIRPKVRPYETDNYYEILMRQARAEKEVEQIVSSAGKKQPERAKPSPRSFQGGTKGNQADSAKGRKRG